MKCRACKSADIVERRENYPYKESGLSNITLVNVPVRHCPACGNRSVVVPRLAELHKTIAFIVAEHSARLSGSEIRFLRKYLGWSQEHFANVIGVTQETTSRWENNAEKIGVPAERALRLLVFRERPLVDYPNDRLAELSKEPEPMPWLLMELMHGQWQRGANMP